MCHLFYVIKINISDPIRYCRRLIQLTNQHISQLFASSPLQLNKRKCDSDEQYQVAQVSETVTDDKKHIHNAALLSQQQAAKQPCCSFISDRVAVLCGAS